MERQNMHIHSKYSWDCERYGMEIEEIARILSENGIKYGAITDHIEFDRELVEDALEIIKIRNLEIDKVNEGYQGKITLLKAVEISEPHFYEDEVARLSELDLDFIMGSIHKIDASATTSSEKDKAFFNYYKEMLKMVEKNQIDVVGHLDYINRYYNGTDFGNTHQIREILKAINENDQILECNTSGKRRNNTDVFPNLNKLLIYMNAGNSEIMIGTDAHRDSELTDNLSETEEIVNSIGLKPVIYQKRKRIIL